MKDDQVNLSLLINVEREKQNMLKNVVLIRATFNANIKSGYLKVKAFGRPKKQKNPLVTLNIDLVK